MDVKPQQLGNRQWDRLPGAAIARGGLAPTHPSQITDYESRIKNSNLFGRAISHELLTLVAARIGASCSAVDLTRTNKIGHGPP
jgi:hypothetical protein